MMRLKSFYRLLNILSIDVALGAVCCAAWFARLFEVNLRPQAFIVLGLTVWIIYTADHILDAKRTHGIASTQRHRFHQQHFDLLMIILTLAVIADLIFVFFIRQAVFQWGLVLSVVMVVYFLVQRFLKYLKELTVAIIFSCGVLLPSVAVTHKAIDFSMALIITEFMLTALLNLLLFSWFDRHNDEEDNRESFVTVAGEKGSKRFVGAVFLLNGGLLLGSALYVPAMIGNIAVLVLMNAVLASMLLKPNYFQTDDRYRIVGDAVFLFPIINLLL
jgi:4-hydroxybenzoate polyprenyltransferase